MAEMYNIRSGGRQAFQKLGNIVLIIACLYWAQKILIPLTLAVLLTFILSPSVIKLQRLGLARIPAVFIVVVVAFSILGIIGWGVTIQLRSLLDEIPQHRQEIADKIKQVQMTGPGPVSNFVDMIHDIGEKLQLEAPQLVDGKEMQRVMLVNDRGPTLAWVASAASSALEFVLSGLFMTILVVFMLAKREDLRNRFFRAVGHSQLAMMTRAIDMAAQRISSYLMTQLLINCVLGFVWSVCLFLIPNGEGGRGVPHALLWGALLVALRFIPYLGTWVALAFPLLLSIALSPVGHLWFQPLLIIGIFLLLELITANLIEPLLFGHNTGVSPVALLIAAVFWAWLWGPVGLMLATPLTVCLIVLGKHLPHLSLLEILLGADSPPETETSYYQRLLVRDEDDAMDIVQDHIKKQPMDRVYDDLLLPALSLAQRDATRGELEPRDEQFIVEATHRILEEVVGHEQRRMMRKAGNSEQPMLQEGRVRVIGCPARNTSDELALFMLAQLLSTGNYQTEIVSAQTLISEVVEKVREEDPSVACISALPPGGLAQASYLCKRLRMHFPDLKILVGRWGQTEDIEKINARLLEAGATKVVTSLQEMRQEVLAELRLQKSDTPANSNGRAEVTSR